MIMIVIECSTPPTAIRNVQGKPLCDVTAQKKMEKIVEEALDDKRSLYSGHRAYPCFLVTAIIAISSAASTAHISREEKPDKISTFEFHLL